MPVQGRRGHLEPSGHLLHGDLRVCQHRLVRLNVLFRQSLRPTSPHSSGTSCLQSLPGPYPDDGSFVLSQDAGGLLGENLVTTGVFQGIGVAYSTNTQVTIRHDFQVFQSESQKTDRHPPILGDRFQETFLRDQNAVFWGGRGVG